MHKESIGKFGGLEGVRSEDLLLSALGEPRQTFDGVFLHNSVFKMAAAYLFCFAKNHAFLDGNKRIALKTCSVFLILNGINLLFNNDEFCNLILECVGNKVDKEQVAAILEANSVF